MSGGVDSSVAAFLTKDMGYDATGITLKLFDNEDIGEKREKTCCSLDDIDDARRVCLKLGIPYYVYNFKDSFKENVIDRFIRAYENGTTPNPCIDCNRFIKFEKLIRRAEELDFDCVVTGHYSTIEYDKGADRYLLKKSVDSTKDQSYVLYCLTQRQLAKTLLPVSYTHLTLPTTSRQRQMCIRDRAELILTVILLIPKVIFSVNTRELSVTP